MPEPITHDELKVALRNRYKMPRWLLLEEVKSSTGFGWATSADAVAFSLYESRGHEIHVFECKASRGDFLGELKKPEKSDGMIKRSDRFYIVAPSGMVKKEELPGPWGLISVSRSGDDGFRLRTVKDVCTERQPGDAPMIDRPFASAMLVRLFRRAEDARRGMVHRDSIQGELDNSYYRGVATGEYQARFGLEKHKKLQKAVDEFQEKTGVFINQYNVHSEAEDYKVFRRFMGDAKRFAHLKVWLEQLEKSLKSTEELQEHFREMELKD